MMTNTYSVLEKMETASFPLDTVSRKASIQIVVELGNDCTSVLSFFN